MPPAVPAAAEPIPRCLQRVHGALCPTCGAPLTLAADGALVARPPAGRAADSIAEHERLFAV